METNQRDANKGEKKDVIKEGNERGEKGWSQVAPSDQVLHWSSHRGYGV